MRRIDEERLNRTIVTLRERLLAARNDQGHWVGHLSSSALSTATAAFALAQVDGARHRTWIERGLHWLCENQNTDGGWGDTIESPSNLSTTLLCYSAMSVSEGGSLKRRSGIAGSWKPCPSPSDLRLSLIHISEPTRPY